MTAAVTVAPPVIVRAQNTPVTPVSPVPPGGAAASRDVDALRATLTDPADTVAQSARDEAARRLASRQSDDARAILRAALQDFGNPATQLAVARALTTDPQPRDPFVVLLNALVGRDRALTAAAATALANYKGDPEVLNLLRRHVANTTLPETSRIAVIRALGTLADKGAAETLVSVLANPNESTPVVNAAADALADMTGLRQNGRDVQRWLDWWAGQRGLSDAEFRDRRLSDRATKYDQLLQRHNQLTEEVARILADQYQAAAANDKEQLLQKDLTNPQPEIRAAGARIITTEAREGRPVPPAARKQLLTMIGDSAPEVRLAVATALGATADPAALDPVLAQLQQEPDPDVRAALAGALANLPDPRAVPALLKMLADDPSNTAVRAAAVALQSVGPLLRTQDPAMATTVSTRLRDALDRRAPANAPGAADLREAIVNAMVPLQDPNNLRTFYALLSINGPVREPIGVRRAALKGLGELHIPDSAEVIRGVLEGDPEPGVRLDAVTALGRIRTFEHANTLYRRLDPNIEPDPSVRDEAWRVLASLLPEAAPDQLAAWADKFNDEPDRKLVIDQVLEKKLAAAGNDDQLATRRQQIGDLLMTRLDRPREAADYYAKALDYWRAHGNAPMATQFKTQLTENRLAALLRSGQYREAVAFGSQAIADDPQNQQTVGVRIKEEADRLVNQAHDPASALRLIAEANNLTPPLPDLYRIPLTQIEQDAKAQLSPRRAATSAPQSRTVRLLGDLSFI